MQDAITWSTNMKHDLSWTFQLQQLVRYIYWSALTVLKVELLYTSMCYVSSKVLEAISAFDPQTWVATRAGLVFFRKNFTSRTSLV